MLAARRRSFWAVASAGVFSLVAGACGEDSFSSCADSKTCPANKGGAPAVPQPTGGEAGEPGAAGSSDPSMSGAGGDPNTGGGGAGSVDPVGGHGGAEVPGPSFTITALPVARVRRGSTTAVPLSVTRSGGFEGAIEITVEGLPTAVTAPSALVGASATDGSLFFTTIVSAGVGGPTPIQVIGTAVEDSAITAELDLELYVADTPGTLDYSFDEDGILTHKITNKYVDWPHDVAIDEKGRIWVAGAGKSPAPSLGWVTRFQEDGQLDGTFGDGGYVLGFDAPESTADALVLVGSGALVGVTRWDGLDPTSFLRMLDEYGEVDQTFGTTGDVIVPNDEIQDLLKWGDAYLVLSDYTPSGVDAGGDLKNDFDPPPDESLEELTNRVAVDGKERVLLGIQDMNGPYTVRRLTTTGMLDNDFGVAGTATYPIPNNHLDASPVSIMASADNDVVLFANSIISDDFQQQEVALIRFDEAGDIIGTFGNFGKAVVSVKGRGIRAFMQTDERIVVLYGNESGGALYCSLARYNSGGDLDQSFGDNGHLDIGVHCALDMAYDAKAGRVLLLNEALTDGMMELTRIWL